MEDQAQQDRRQQKERRDDEPGGILEEQHALQLNLQPHRTGRKGADAPLKKMSCEAVKPAARGSAGRRCDNEMAQRR
jgi:hypothetical protein